MKHTFIRIRVLAAGTLAALSLAACGGGSSAPPSPPPQPPAAPGTLSIAITNKHACDLDAVNITFARFAANKAERAIDPPLNGWVDVPVIRPGKINLIGLTNGAQEVVAQATLEAGLYSWLQVGLDTGNMANSVVPRAGDAEQPLESPYWAKGSPRQYGFEVVAGQKTTIVFDANGCAPAETSADGQRYFPGMGPVTPASNGITGFVSPAALANHVLVTAQWRKYYNWIVASTKPDPVTGEFRLLHFEPDEYDIVITADNSAASLIGAVPVSATDATVVSTRDAPIELAPSPKSGAISGTLTFSSFPRNGSSADVAAKQVFAPGQYATVQYKPADAATDTFTLSNLPLAPPRFALYTSTLPLAFTTAPTGGKYNVVASSPGRLNNQVSDVDISTGDKTGVNLLLIPSGP